MRKGPAWFHALSTVGILSSTPAFANGRFPRAERLIENPGDANQLAIAGTYGILTTSDRGRSWYHVCEASFSLKDGYLGDPLLDVRSDQSWWVGVQTSLNISRDRGCNWKSVLRGDSVFVIDDTFAKTEPSVAFALLANYEGGAITYSLQQSNDDGTTWTVVGQNIPAETVYTIDVDPRDATHLYATALVDDIGRFLSSTDGGRTWAARVIPNTDASNAPYIAGVDPRDSRAIYVRTDAWVTIDGSLTANDALLYSADGGETWAQLFVSRAKLYGFALSPDGSTVLIGYGDPQEGAGQVVSGPFGIFKSSTDVFAFHSIFAGRVGCLAWTKTGVYVCGSQSFDGFELAFSENADFSLQSGCLTPLLFLDQVKGPLACGADSTGNVCNAAWDLACMTFGACVDASAAVTNCVGASGPTRDAGSGAHDATTGKLTAAGGGAGCSAAPTPVSGDVAAVLGLCELALLCRRRSARRVFLFAFSEM